MFEFEAFGLEKVGCSPVVGKKFITRVRQISLEHANGPRTKDIRPIVRSSDNWSTLTYKCCLSTGATSYLCQCTGKWWNTLNSLVEKAGKRVCSGSSQSKTASSPTCDVESFFSHRYLLIQPESSYLFNILNFLLNAYSETLLIKRDYDDKASSHRNFVRDSQLYSFDNGYYFKAARIFDENSTDEEEPFGWYHCEY